MGHCGRSGAQKHPGRISPLCLSLDAAVQHKADQFETVAVETGGADHDPHNYLNRINGFKMTHKVTSLGGTVASIHENFNAVSPLCHLLSIKTNHIIND